MTTGSADIGLRLQWGDVRFMCRLGGAAARPLARMRSQTQRLPSRAARPTFAVMGRTADYSKESCSVAAALQVVGDPWTLLILRDAFLGVRRFDDWQARLGVARNVLASRLKSLVEQGVLETRLYSQHPPRKDYVLTRKG